MHPSSVELGADESIVASHEFPSKSAFGTKVVLTNRRLVVLAKGVRESHPLSKIQSIRIESGRNIWLVLLWVAIAAAGIFPAVLVAKVYLASGGHAVLAAELREGYIMASIGLLLSLGCAWGAVVAARGYLRLAVELPSGSKAYAIQNRDPMLLLFVQRVEQSL